MDQVTRIYADGKAETVPANTFGPKYELPDGKLVDVVARTVTVDGECLPFQEWYDRNSWDDDREVIAALMRAHQ